MGGGDRSVAFWYCSQNASYTSEFFFAQTEETSLERQERQSVKRRAVVLVKSKLNNERWIKCQENARNQNVGTDTLEQLREKEEDARVQGMFHGIWFTTHCFRR